MKEFRVMAALLCLLPLGMLHAEAPELERLFPSSWRQLERVAEVEEADVLRQAARSESEVRGFPSVPDGVRLEGLSGRAVYRQRAGDGVFYRVLLTAQPLEIFMRHAVAERDYTEPEWEALRGHAHVLLQAVFYQGPGGLVFLLSDVFGFWLHSNRAGWQVYYGDFQIVPLEGSSQTGLLWLHAKLPVQTGQTREGLVHVRPRPAVIQEAEYFLLERRADGGLAGHPAGGSSPVCSLSASDCWFEPDSPLRHSLLCAFDGRADTSFRENSGDSIISMQLSIDLGEGFARSYGRTRITQAAVINGDAVSRAAYMQNNRIATFAVKARKVGDEYLGEETLSFSLKDYTLDVQTLYLPFRPDKNFIEFHTADLYRGTPYNRTCIAEFNLKIAGFGWLFGPPGR